MGWTGKYEANVKPDADGWTLNGVDDASVSSGILTINTALTDLDYYTRTWAADNTTGWTIEVSAKVVSANYIGNNLSFIGLGAQDNSHFEYVMFHTDKIVAYDNGTYTSYTMDTTNAFHTYRLTVSGTTAKTYVDGILVLTTTASATGGGSLIFGDLSSTALENCNIQWDYFYWDLNGAFPPDLFFGNFSNLTLLGVG